MVCTETSASRSHICEKATALFGGRTCLFFSEAHGCTTWNYKGQYPNKNLLVFSYGDWSDHHENLYLSLLSEEAHSWNNGHVQTISSTRSLFRDYMPCVCQWEPYSNRLSPGHGTSIPPMPAQEMSFTEYFIILSNSTSSEFSMNFCEFKHRHVHVLVQLPLS